MYDQPKTKPLARSTFFEDERGSRPLVEDTVARGELRADDLLETGMQGGKPSAVFPFPVTAEVLDRGEVKFNIFCSVCHGRLGDGEGMIVKRGFKRPPSFHTDRLRESAPGHFVDVMVNGFGAMYDYRGRISSEDRWAIAAYIRALQLSQHVSPGELSPEQRALLPKGSP